MLVGILLAAALMGRTADSATAPAAPPQEVAGPQAPGSEPAKIVAAEASKDCSPTAPDPNSREVVVCVQKPQGFRIDPDVIAAKKAKREASRGRLKTPQDKLRDNSCTVVGAQGCIFAAPGINLLAARRRRQKFPSGSRKARRSAASSSPSRRRTNIDIIRTLRRSGSRRKPPQP